MYEMGHLQFSSDSISPNGGEQEGRFYGILSWWVDENIRQRIYEAQQRCRPHKTAACHTWWTLKSNFAPQTISSSCFSHTDITGWFSVAELVSLPLWSTVWNVSTTIEQINLWSPDNGGDWLLLILWLYLTCGPISIVDICGFSWNVPQIYIL